MCVSWTVIDFPDAICSWHIRFLHRTLKLWSTFRSWVQIPPHWFICNLPIKKELKYLSGARMHRMECVRWTCCDLLSQWAFQRKFFLQKFFTYQMNSISNAHLPSIRTGWRVSSGPRPTGYVCKCQIEKLLEIFMYYLMNEAKWVRCQCLTEVFDSVNNHSF